MTENHYVVRWTDIPISVEDSRMVGRTNGQSFSAGNRSNKIINYGGSAHTRIQLNGKINGRGGAHHNNDMGTD